MVMVRTPALLSLTALFGCGGANDATLLNELRVISMLPESPEVNPGETTQLNTRVVDPQAVGAEVLVWTCTPLGETCLEDDEGRVVTVVTLDSGTVTTAITPSPALAAFASETPAPLMLIWALACTPGTCDLIGDAAAGASIAPEIWADPFAWMPNLPIEGTSLAYTTLNVSTRPSETRHVNPTLTVSPEAPSVAPEGTLELAVAVDGDVGDEAKLWGYAEAGGFSATDERVNPSGTTLRYVAPAETGEWNTFVLLVDGLGGGALWEGRVTVSD